MYVCVCAGITDQNIRDAIAEGDHSLKALRNRLNIAHGCGMCVRETRQILDDELRMQAAATLATELVARPNTPRPQQPFVQPQRSVAA